MTSRQRTISRIAHGFTLTELAVVMVVVSLLIGGMLIPLSTQQDIGSRQATEKSLATVREALAGFAAINGRLPCPADPAIATGLTSAGLEATTGTGTTLVCACTTSTSRTAKIGATACPNTAATDHVGGVLPWATLGLNESDAWGNRFSYRASTYFARGLPQTTFGCVPASNPTLAAFALCTPGAIEVRASSGGAIVASSIPAIVISHGKSAGGAYTTNASTVGGVGSTEEQANLDTNESFISNSAMDDQLVWISPPILMNRMLAAGKLP